MSPALIIQQGSSSAHGNPVRKLATSLKRGQLQSLFLAKQRPATKKPSKGSKVKQQFKPHNLRQKRLAQKCFLSFFRGGPWRGLFPSQVFWFHRFSNGNLKNLEPFPWMQNDGCHRTSLGLPSNWALEKPLPLLSMCSDLIFGLKTTRKLLKSSRGKKGTRFFQICFHEFHGFTLPETNSKSTWKWMVGRWSIRLPFGMTEPVRCYRCKFRGVYITYMPYCLKNRALGFPGIYIYLYLLGSTSFYVLTTSPSFRLGGKSSDRVETTSWKPWTLPTKSTSKWVVWGPVGLGFQGYLSNNPSTRGSQTSKPPGPKPPINHWWIRLIKKKHYLMYRASLPI